MTDIELIERAVEEEAERILAANDRIWEFAELPFHEDKFQPVLREHFRLAQEDR